MNPTDATLAAISAVVAAIERCPQAVEARDRAALLIRAAANEPAADLASIEHSALLASAEAAIYVLEADPALSHLVTTGRLAGYIMRQAVVIALGSDGSAVPLVLRDPHAN
jgi:hypothetical protein